MKTLALLLVSFLAWGGTPPERATPSVSARQCHLSLSGRSEVEDLARQVVKANAEEDNWVLKKNRYESAADFFERHKVFYRGFAMKDFGPAELASYFLGDRTHEPSSWYHSALRKKGIDLTEVDATIARIISERLKKLGVVKFTSNESGLTFATIPIESKDTYADGGATGLWFSPARAMAQGFIPYSTIRVNGMACVLEVDGDPSRFLPVSRGEVLALSHVPIAIMRGAYFGFRSESAGERELDWFYVEITKRTADGIPSQLNVYKSSEDPEPDAFGYYKTLKKDHLIGTLDLQAPKDQSEIKRMQDLYPRIRPFLDGLYP